MKVVIQHPISHYYLTHSDEWTPVVEDARLFKSGADAVSNSIQNLPPPFNVVMKFEDPTYDFTVLASEPQNPGVSLRPEFRTNN